MPAQRAWAQGRKVTKIIGFLGEEEYRLKRADARAHAGAFSADSDQYDYRFLLMVWGMDLDACIRTIERAGLHVPPKSSCYYCSSMKPDEVRALSPLERGLIVLQELSAEPYNTKMHGLWRRPRKIDGRPGSITEFILQEGLEFVPLTDICTKVVLNPRCSKARVGYSLRPDPTHRPRDQWLSEQLREHGHRVPPILLSGESEAPGAYRDMHILDRVQSVLEGTAHARLAAHAATELGIGGRPSRALPVLDQQTSLFGCADPCSGGARAAPAATSAAPTSAPDRVAERRSTATCAATGRAGHTQSVTSGSALGFLHTVRSALPPKMIAPASSSLRCSEGVDHQNGPAARISATVMLRATATRTPACGLIPGA